ncbi:hypothetical protein D9619_005163 [Psilocybe cf. subviscida]|uniref:Inorganic phosphate transporter n=1 Tax=Psilocybe cf. subviscida TaxID=2480587 RepID=A0A8H5BNZ4_9AGAR|nr:hypothetical protein D9619_005163 [Psilocybe cf. subviscida]
MNSGVQNLVISLGAMQLARKIPFDDPSTLNIIRVSYVGVQLVVLAVYYFISLQIKKKNDQTVLKYVEPSGPMSQDDPKLVTTTVRDYDLAETSKGCTSYLASPLRLFGFGSFRYIGGCYCSTFVIGTVCVTSVVVIPSSFPTFDSERYFHRSAYGLHQQGYPYPRTVLGAFFFNLRSVYTGVAMMGVMHIYFHFTQPLFIQALMGLKNLYDAKVVQIYLMGKPATGDMKRPFKTQGMFGPATGPQTDAAAIAEAEKKIGKKDD